MAGLPGARQRRSGLCSNSAPAAAPALCSTPLLEATEQHPGGLGARNQWCTLYGTASQGGNNSNGTVFKLDPAGVSFAVVHHFDGNVGDGRFPYSELLLGDDGLLYGTTYGGGSQFQGTVFKLNTDGTSYTLLHQFAEVAGDGTGPLTGLAQDLDGILYGTTSRGGSNDRGTIFKLSTNGTDYVVLHSFGDYAGDGDAPAGVVPGSDGMLYGTTTDGSSGGFGTVFRLNKDGTGYEPLCRFNGSNGKTPVGGLVQGGDAAFYGTTTYGGDMGFGTVFRLLAPPRIGSYARLADGSFQVAAHGFPSITYRIEASPI